MMKMKKIGTLLGAAVLSCAMLAMPVYAESSSFSGSVTYKGGDSIEADFTKEDIQAALGVMQPGDDITITVKYTNEADFSTEWYFLNDVIKKLKEDMPDDAFRYKLTNSADDEPLYDSTKTGLEQGANGLGEWFKINTLKKGESGTIELYIELDGEMLDNSYMDTEAEVLIQFAVEKTPEEPTPTPSVKPTVTPKPISGVNTWDSNPIGIFIGILAAGVGVLVVALVVRKRRMKKEDQE